MSGSNSESHSIDNGNRLQETSDASWLDETKTTTPTIQSEMSSDLSSPKMSDEKATTPTGQPEIGAASGDRNMNDLSSLIQGVLQQTQDRFQHMSDQIIRRIDDMTTRIDDLEKSISDLLQSNQVDHPPPSAN